MEFDYTRRMNVSRVSDDAVVVTGTDFGGDFHCETLVLSAGSGARVIRTGFRDTGKTVRVRLTDERDPLRLRRRSWTWCLSLCGAPRPALAA